MKKCFYPFILIFLLLTSNLMFAATNPCWSVAISSSPSPAYPGDTMTFTATLQVKFEAVANLRVIGVVDGVTLYDNTFAALGAGVTRAVNMTWPATLGEHTAYFRLDPDDTIAEVGTDNTTTKTFTISARPPVTPLNIYFSDNSIAPVREVSGEETFINYSIRIGEPWESDFSFNVIFKVNGTQRDSHTYSTGGGGLSFNRTGQFPWHTECGATYEVIIDPLNAVIETNEADNSWMYTVSCVEPERPDLSIVFSPSLWEPGFIHAGETITAYYRVGNGGIEDSGAFKVGVKAGDRIIARSSHTGLGHGEGINGSVSFTAECGGPLSLMVDCDSEIIEEDETNNTRQDVNFKCAVPNLKAWTLSGSFGDSNNVAAGRSYEYTFHYMLSDDSSVSNVRLRIGVVGGEVLLDEVVPTVELSGGTSRDVRAIKTFEPGSYTIYGIVDPENTIAESNETDNRKEMFIRVVGEGSTTRRLTPSGPIAKTNYKIIIGNKRELQKANIARLSENSVNGLLSCTGPESLLKANLNVALYEENITAHSKRLVWEETINIGPGENKKFKWRWSPAEAGKMKLVLIVKPTEGDSNASDNKDDVIVQVK